MNTTKNTHKTTVPDSSHSLSEQKNPSFLKKQKKWIRTLPFFGVPLILLLLAFAVTNFSGNKFSKNHDLKPAVTPKVTSSQNAGTNMDGINTNSNSTNNDTSNIDTYNKNNTNNTNNTDNPTSNNSNTNSTHNSASTTPPTVTKITISAAGDCTFGSDIKSPSGVNFYAKYNEKKSPSYFFKKVKKVFQKDDLTLVNFEGTLTNRTTRADKKYAFKGDSSYINILKKGSVEAVSFANNHCHDYGQGSYTDTISVFKKHNIPFASYDKTAIYTVKGIKIGMIAVNGLEGISISQHYIKTGIKKLKKKKADLILVSIHAGIEHTPTINNVQTTLAHYSIKKGANLVLGHHPHTLQGIEKYKGAYIVYSLGNFCFGGNTNPADKDTMIFQQTFTFKNNTYQKGNAIRIIPCSISSKNTINDYQPVIAKGATKKRILANMNRFCKPYHLTFNSHGTLSSTSSKEK